MGNPLKILSIKEAIDGFKLDEGDRGYTYLNGEKIDHLRIMGRAIQKFINKEKTYGTITLDDESSTVIVKFFSGNIDELEQIQIGDLIEVSCRMGIFQDQIHVISESCGILNDVNYEFLRKLEILFRVDKREDEMLEIIRENKKMTFEELQAKFNEKTQEILSTLLNKGEIYEISPKTYSSV